MCARERRWLLRDCARDGEKRSSSAASSAAAAAAGVEEKRDRSVLRGEQRRLSREAFYSPSEK